MRWGFWGIAVGVATVTDRDFRRLAAGVALAALATGGIAPAMAQTAAEEGLSRAPDFIVERYRAKAEAGEAQAQFRLGYLHENGLISGTPDIAAAADWYARAAEGGHAAAQFKRGSLYAAGLGGPRDFAKAASLYEAAAKQGVAEAQYNLAILLQDGIGVEKDSDAAIRWYEQAAFRGVLPAMRALGLLYLSGVGRSPQDDIEAWAWLTLAVENGDTAMADHLKSVDGKLEDKARDEAGRLADAYRQLRIVP